jgi:hypothetical protein
VCTHTVTCAVMHVHNLCVIPIRNHLTCTNTKSVCTHLYLLIPGTGTPGVCAHRQHVSNVCTPVHMYVCVHIHTYLYMTCCTTYMTCMCTSLCVPVYTNQVPRYCCSYSHTSHQRLHSKIRTAHQQHPTQQ